MTATEQGKEFAQTALANRRERYRGVIIPRNEDLPAGSPMYFRCRGCGDVMIEPEGHIDRAKFCSECQSLIDLGWMR